MWELFDIALDLGSHFLGEFPEDLGATSTGVPASIWQMEAFFVLISNPGVLTFALFQCEFGGKSAKPTRLITDLQGFEGPFYQGIPIFNQQWKYQGPLPKCCPHPGQHEQLIGLDDSGKWKTAPAAHYPKDTCLFIARAIAKTWRLHSAASEGSSLPTKTKHTGNCSETSGTLQGECIMEDSGTFEFPLNGSLDEDEAVEVDRDRLQGPSYDWVFAVLVAPLRDRWFNLLPDPRQASSSTPGQPFYLHALAQFLRLLGDPDVDVIDNSADSNFIDGVHLGHIHPLGPTPQVYRRRVKPARYDDSEWA